MVREPSVEASPSTKSKSPIERQSGIIRRIAREGSGFRKVLDLIALLGLILPFLGEGIAQISAQHLREQSNLGAPMSNPDMAPPENSSAPVSAENHVIRGCELDFIKPCTATTEDKSDWLRWKLEMEFPPATARTSRNSH